MTTDKEGRLIFIKETNPDGVIYTSTYTHYPNGTIYAGKNHPGKG